ncbi:MAG: hypothetical protein JXQ65_05470 [Candidatus Marinimicrobia bacterium]|nr:hypothetical protein [Candidatus Neomarinimicrobiota bacterium]
MKKITLALLMIAVFCYGQYGYWGHYLLDKAYEENPGFLMPIRSITPEMESLGEEMTGLYSDILSNMSFNPALLADVTHALFQIDFANQKPLEPAYSSIFPFYNYADNCMFVPPYYQRTIHQEISPLFRIASAFQAEKIPANFAFSYELIKYTGNYYENYSYGGYQYGYDAFNERAMDEAVIQVPEIMAAGDDTKSKLSHKLSMLSALKMSQDISAGIKFSFFSDHVDGDYRSFQRNNDDETDYENYYDNTDTRNNKINQYEATFGVNYENEFDRIGFSGGWITGSDKQQRLRVDTSYYYHDQEDYLDYECFYKNSNSSLHQENWKNTGNTGFISINGSHVIQNFNLLYRVEYLLNQTDISNNGQSQDTAYYHSSHYDNYNLKYYFYENQSGSHENRTGDGIRDQSRYTIGLALQNENPKKNFSLGIIYQQYYSDKEVVENSLDQRKSDNFSELYQWRQQDQNTDLKFNRTETIRNLKIPVSFVFHSKNGWRLRTTLTKIIGDREATESVLIKYYSYLLVSNDEEINKHQNELYKGTPEKESIDRILFRAYVEGDFSENITFFVLFNDLFVSKGNEYRYYNTDSDLLNIGNWKFGLEFKF